jgi:hypothetical protein
VDECREKIVKKDPLARETKESIVLKDILNSYYLFNKLEHYLQYPPRFKEQLMFQTEEDLADKLIEK